MVARREVSLADVLEIKLGNRGSGGARRVGMYLTEEIETEGEPDADITEKDRHKDRETKSKR